ncbi:DUF2177 family protein [Marichromatium gracile]|uniref:Putative membrane protein n=1 Tax=Marichromatium gracile TaxID=1048 RepID=A0A4R4ADJ7_MARGR|nr:MULTISPECIES: DUF2177 family protein [Marichromatium]MBK1710643.1 hypothetical protein [Marichromatium gracile]MCF1182725.1 DUF2177 family protein [Marichromatium gracile]RNE94016.1 DUF2177 family protein [Marichromatium sp. AB32]TCW37161.1 putative membrane protein [Marichromatium gracile]
MGPWFVIKLYLLTFTVFMAIDLLWLGVVARGFYRAQLAHLLADTTRWPAAIAFYLIYVAGILVMAILPGVEAGSLDRTLLLAAGFGFFTYITYELTNMATLPDWPLRLVLVDTLWGVVLCTLVGAAGFYLARLLG